MLARFGLVRASFIPPKDLRELRLVSRYRRHRRNVRNEPAGDAGVPTRGQHEHRRVEPAHKSTTVCAAACLAALQGGQARRTAQSSKPKYRNRILTARKQRFLPAVHTLTSCASSTTANSNGACLPAANAAASVVNMPACVLSRCAFSPLRTCSKMDHSTARCASGSLVLRPSRATSRYDSQVANYQASTTWSHSATRNCKLSLWPLTAADAA